MKKNLQLLTVLSAAAVLAAAAPMINPGNLSRALAAEKGWIRENGAWRFYGEEGMPETDTWKKKESDWFYLNEEGYPALSQRIDDFYVGSDGRMVKNKWVAAEEDSGYESPDSPESGSWMYFGKDGKLTLDRWLSVDGKTYRFDADGYMMTGLLELDGSAYYLGPEQDGVRRTGWVLLEEITGDPDDEGIWSYFDHNGKMVVKQLNRRIGERAYTFLDGKMQTGWVNLREAGFLTEDLSATPSGLQKPSLSDFRYYDGEGGGHLASGWFLMEGAPGISEEEEEFWFYFRSGVPNSSKEGIELFSIGSDRFAFNERGEMQTGLQTLRSADGSPLTYYFDANGIMKTGRQTLYNDELEENQTWYFHTKGSRKGQGVHGEHDRQLYVNGLLKKADPELRYEPVSVDGKRYLVNTSGTLQKASGSSVSASRPELGKGFRDVKDSSDAVWTVDSSGIIQ